MIRTLEVPKPRILTPQSCKEFSSHYPKGSLTVVRNSNISTKAMDLFEGYSRRFILPESYVAGDFHQFFIVKKDDGEETHVAYQTKDFHCNERVVERELYLYEVGLGGDKLGHAEIRYSLSDDELRRAGPFVGFTQTEESLRRQGRGTDRLMVMNALSRTLYGRVLVSDSFPRSFMESERCWQVLVERGIAQRHAPDRWKKYKYSFKP
jgi:hypothetical protein